MIDQTLVSINGIIKDSKNAMISVFDRSFLFGDSIYEATLVKNKVPLFWKEHLTRLHESARLISMPLLVRDETINQWIEKLINHFHHPQGLLRLVLTRGEGPVNLNPASASVHNNVVIFLAPLSYPQEWYEIGLKYGISSYERNSLKSTTPLAKTGNYLNSQLSLMEAKKLGYDDAIMLNAKGFITEGTTNNIWFIKGGKVFTADDTQGILKGITRIKIMECLDNLNIMLNIGAWSLENLVAADEVFMTSATKGVVPIIQVGPWKIADGKPGELTNLIRNSYEKLVNDYVQNSTWK